MKSFIVLASLVSELAGGQNDPPFVLNVTKKHLSPLRVNELLIGFLLNYILNCPVESD